MSLAPDVIATAATAATQPVAAAGAEAAAKAADRTAALLAALPGWPDQADILRICGKTHPIVAAILLLLGVIYLIFGYTVFRLLVTLNLAGLGAWGGWLVGKQFGAGTPGLIVGGVLLAALAWPTMKYTVAFCGAVMGFLVGVSLWRACGLADTYAAAGGAIGAVYLAMLAFIAFKGTIIATTSLEGAVLLILGGLAMSTQLSAVKTALPDQLAAVPYFLPIALLTLGVVGIVFQLHYNKPAAKPPVPPAK